MGKRTKSKKIELNQDSGFKSTLGDALKNHKIAPSLSTQAPSPITPEPATTPVPTLNFSSLKKVILRREKKGRGGKTVTLVQGIEAPQSILEELAKAMRKELGCGARIENSEITLQGDMRERAAAWLTQKGVVRIVQS